MDNLIAKSGWVHFFVCCLGVSQIFIILKCMSYRVLEDYQKEDFFL